MLIGLSAPASAEGTPSGDVSAYNSLDQSLSQIAAQTSADGLVRLHVVAGDDSDAAQQLKLTVRDAVLDCARSLLADCTDADAAYARLTACLPALEQVAAYAAGPDHAVRAETGVFPFPDRDYAGVTVPAGDYRALRIVIDGGAGRNWWCILFPTLCTTTDGHSALADWLGELFGGDPS
ncbi:MAG: stage II sporulation protein R [Candidatus Faecivicinus sp.]